MKALAVIIAHPKRSMPLLREAYEQATVQNEKINYAKILAILGDNHGVPTLIAEVDAKNEWDDGYPSGGNFWSNYNGSDKFSGPNQDIPGNDGIGDTNFTFDADSSDNYPLYSPVGSCLYLYRGWNLISIPFNQSDTNLGTVLNAIKGAYDIVQWYNLSDTSNPWKQNITKKPSYLNDLDHIDNTMGFWIHITEPGGILFQYPGAQPLGNQTINIYPGWNLIGYPSLTRHNRTEGLNNIIFGTHVDAIWTFDGATQTWEDVGPGEVPDGLAPYLPGSYDFDRGAYLLDYENWTLPGGLPKHPNTRTLLGISINTSDAALGQAVVDLLGSAWAHYSLGETYTFVIESM